MRASRADMARHHDEIVAAAARMLRRCGIDRTSVIELMKSVGLTHGGFYKHFKSKDDLVVESTRCAFQQVLERYKTRSKQAGAKAALRNYVAEYLSRRHIDQPGQGCPIAAYGTDASRESPIVHAAFADGIIELIDQIETGLSCPQTRRRAQAMELLALLSGAITTARAVGEGSLAKQIVSAARERADHMIEESR